MESSGNDGSFPMTSTTTGSLTPLQVRVADRAREVLGSPADSDTASLAARIGQLEWPGRDDRAR